jgi:hypothetical protein
MSFVLLNTDGLVKSRKRILFVIPAKAGIQCSRALTNSWTPFFNGVTTFYESINTGSGQLRAIRCEKDYMLRRLLAIGHESLDLARDLEYTER